MDILFIANIVALCISLFVAGAILGAFFSQTVREKLVALIPPRLVPEFLTLAKSSHNPILKPGGHPWTAEAVLNPAAAVIGGRTHLVYRAIGMDGVSRLGYASSQDGIVFDDRPTYPAYVARNPGGGLLGSRRRYSPVLYPSGGSWGGCEDPRMAVIDGYVYVTFNMFEDWKLRVGVISMSEEDFLAKRFHRWEGPIILTHSDREKNWMLFPEKIAGQFAVLHSIIGDSEGSVRIEFVDDLADLVQRRFASPDPQQVPDTSIAWHVRVRSAGPPPLRTERGWLLFYHAHDAREPSRYKLGAMLLDLADPTKILCRAIAPVISPDEPYENHGKPGIVYACGACVRPSTTLGTGAETLFVYYGGADKVVCVATAPLDAFLDALILGSQPSLATMTLAQTT